MTTDLTAPLLGNTPANTAAGQIPSLAAGDIIGVIERAADGRIYYVSIGQFDARYQALATILTTISSAAPQAHIIDADGTLADITTKFNTLLSSLQTLGLLDVA